METMKMVNFIYLLFLLHTSQSRCLNLCDCERKAFVINIACRERDLDDIPQDLPCNIGLLDLSRNFITTLKKESFSCQNELAALLLSNNHLRIIEQKVFDDAEHLVYIDLSSNFLESLPYLGSLPFIQEISIIRNSLTDWNHQTLSNVSGPHLSSLRLAFNKLKNLPEFQFEISAVDLKGNAITDLSKKMFIHPRTVSSLDISYNDVEYLYRLQTMENLKTLSLAFNQIREITTTVFIHLPSIETINLKGNNIVDVSAIHDIPHIKSIILDNNQIRSINRPAFNNIPDIEHINLQHNKIIEIKGDYYFNVPTSLLLSHNNMIAMNIFQGKYHYNFTVLNVDDNNLQVLSLIYFPDITYMFASHNKITMLEFGINDYEHLVYINLSWNYITNITNFQNLTNVQSLHLSHNFLTKWSDQNLLGSSQLILLRVNDNRLSLLSNFTALPRLKDLDLSGNVLHTIEQSSFQFLQRLATLNLAKNKISHLGFLRPITSLKMLNLNYNRLVAIDPKDFSNLINLRTLHIAFNLLGEVPTIPKSLNSLQNLDISHNLLPNLNLHHAFNQSTPIYINAADNRITQVISTSNLHLNINNNAIGASNSSLLSAVGNIFACNNKLTDFKHVRFSSTLKGLYLNKNQIATIPNFTFVFASSLFFLELDDNQIVDISHLAFIGLQFVVRIKLERNRLSHLHSGVFSNIQELQHLYLNGNPFIIISSRLFSGIPGILGIYFSNIPASNMSIQALQDIQTVRYLDLHKNLAFQALIITNSSIQQDVALEFSNLLVLNLSSNNLGNSCPSLLITTLNAIDYSNNTITSIPRLCLPIKSRPYNLFLSHNQIQNVSKDSFDKHQQFQLLDLRYNNIVFFELGSLQHQTHLIYLYLQGNQLTKIHLAISTFSLKPIFIYLQNNHLSCDCQLLKIIRALRQIHKPTFCQNPSLQVNSSIAELTGTDPFKCRPQLCSPPYQPMLLFVGDKMIELPCPIKTSNNIYWSVSLKGQQLLTSLLPDGVEILPHHALIISYVRKNLTGLYSCWAENEGGQTKFTAELLVEDKIGNMRKGNYNHSVMLASKWKDTLVCGNKPFASSQCNIISKSYNSLFVLALGIHSLITK
ncbi:chaoptin-like [Lytechinus variegatus]|uniref:chaoptin-like n=1 Tax=Lytechinus variegatus TaxID=7654 RepID=UPI001BB16A9B|nr:chaoptin-like [Lytechinus variegatus]